MFETNKTTKKWAVGQFSRDFLNKNVKKEKEGYLGQALNIFSK